jgi:hypothetical protein
LFSGGMHFFINFFILLFNFIWFILSISFCCLVVCGYLFVIAHKSLDLALDDVVGQLPGGLVLDAANVCHGQAVPAVDPAEELTVKFGEKATLALLKNKAINKKLATDSFAKKNNLDSNVRFG